MKIAFSSLRKESTGALNVWGSLGASTIKLPPSSS